MNHNVPLAKLKGHGFREVETKCMGLVLCITDRQQYIYGWIGTRFDRIHQS